MTTIAGSKSITVVCPCCGKEIVIEVGVIDAPTSCIEDASAYGIEFGTAK